MAMYVKKTLYYDTRYTDTIKISADMAVGLNGNDYMQCCCLCH